MVNEKFEKIPELMQNLDIMNGLRRPSPIYFEKSVLMFFSFDIENSSSYKEKYEGSWSETIYKILQNIMTMFETSTTGGYEFWKSLGDEIIYTKKIYTMQDIITSLEETYSKLTFLNECIEEGIICSKEEGKILALKATTWICVISSSSEFTENVRLEFQIKDNRKQYDFLGPDIDRGFRTSKYSIKNHMVISYKLAYMIANCEEISSNIEKLKLLSFQKLKGVWDGRDYPIILYHADKQMSFLETLEDNIQRGSNVLQEYMENVYEKTQIEYEGFKTYEDKVIKELYQRHNIAEQCNVIIDTITKQDLEFYKYTGYLQKRYCKILCYTIIDGKINFVLNRQKGETMWGIQELEQYVNVHFINDITDNYKDKTGIVITIKNDIKYHGKVPKILLTYEHEDRNMQNQGNVLLGETKQTVFEDYKNYQFKVVSLDEMQGLENCDEQIKKYILNNIDIIL
ncbi:MAG: hypothetical protein R3Y09_09585 [Clostridia bacterium]